MTQHDPGRILVHNMTYKVTGSLVLGEVGEAPEGKLAPTLTRTQYTEQKPWPSLYY